MPRYASLLLLLSSALALSSAQLTCNGWGSGGVNNLPLDNGQATARLGGRWSADDFPKNLTTQDFREINRPNGWLRNYVYIGNTGAALNSFNQHWLPQNLSDKLSEDPYVRPMGFKYSLITPLNEQYPCVEIQGVGGFGVEIMVYALVDVEICIRHLYEASSLNAQSAQLFNDVCAQQRLRHCFIAPDFYGASGRPTSTNFEIYIRQSNPVDYTVPVFYRVRKSEFPYKDQGSQFSSGNTEMWCMMISGSVDTSYPEFTNEVPQNIQIPQVSAARRGSAVGMVVTTVVAFVAVVW